MKLWGFTLTLTQRVVRPLSSFDLIRLNLFTSSDLKNEDSHHQIPGQNSHPLIARSLGGDLERAPVTNFEFFYFTSPTLPQGDTSRIMYK